MENGESGGKSTEKDPGVLSGAFSPRGQCRLPPGPHRGSTGASRQGDTGGSEPLSWAGLRAETRPSPGEAHRPGLSA